jgi:hypothetical protein
MGISVSTLCEWKNKFPELSEALKKGREVADYIVENELFESCKTRTVTVKKPIKLKKVMVDGKKRLEEERIEYAEEQVVVPANVTAQIFWLKNRRPEKWAGVPEETRAKEHDDDGLLEALSAAAGISPPDDVEMLPEEEDNHAEK